MTLKAIQARQPELYFDYTVFWSVYEENIKQKKGRRDREISKLQTVIKIYTREKGLQYNDNKNLK